MSAAVLRQAAAALRERADDATPGPWSSGGNAVRVGREAIALTYTPFDRATDHDQKRKDAAYIAAVHPWIGQEIAVLLDQIAERVEAISDATPTVEFGERVAAGNLTGYTQALVIARLINGSQS